jgi:broad specificity phosphatase PhoE
MLLTIVRHGECREQVEPAERKNPDSSLSETGRLHARLTGQRLREGRPTRVVSSPLKRALETADEIARACDVDAVEVWDEVREGLGITFTGNDDAAMLACCSRARAVGLFEGGNWVNVRDTRDSFLTRCESAFHRLFVEVPRDRHTVLVTHGAFTNWLIHRALELPPHDNAVAWFEIDNGSITQIEIVDEPQVKWPFWWLYPSIRLKVLRVNDTCHLAPAIVPRTNDDAGVSRNRAEFGVPLR